MKSLIISLLIILLICNCAEAKKSKMHQKKAYHKFISNLASQAEALVKQKGDIPHVITKSDDVTGSTTTDEEDLIEKTVKQTEGSFSVKEEQSLKFEGDVENTVYTGKQILKMLKFNSKLMEICGEDLEKCDFSSDDVLENHDEKIANKDKFSSFMQTQNPLSEQEKLEHQKAAIQRYKEKMAKHLISFTQLGFRVTPAKNSLPKKAAKAAKGAKVNPADIRAFKKAENARFNKALKQKFVMDDLPLEIARKKSAKQIEDDQKRLQVQFPEGSKHWKMMQFEIGNSKSQGKLTNNPAISKKLYLNNYREKLKEIEFRFKSAYSQKVKDQKHVQQTQLPFNNKRFAQLQNLPSIRPILRRNGFKNKNNRMKFMKINSGLIRFRQLPEEMRFKRIFPRPHFETEDDIRRKLKANPNVLRAAEKKLDKMSFAQQVRDETQIENSLNGAVYKKLYDRK